MTLDPRTRAVIADRRVQKIEHNLRVFGFVSGVLVLIFVIAAATLSGIAAYEGRSAAQAAKAQSIANHRIEVANEKILHQLLRSSKRQRQAIKGERVLVQDLRRIIKAVGLDVALTPIPSAHPTPNPQPSPPPTSPSAKPHPAKPQPPHKSHKKPPKPKPKPKPTCTVVVVTSSCTKL